MILFSIKLNKPIHTHTHTYSNTYIHTDNLTKTKVDAKDLCPSFLYGVLSMHFFGECSSDKQHTDHTLIAIQEPSKFSLDLRPAWKVEHL